MESPTLTLAASAGAGTLLIIVAQRLRVPSIVLLLIGGVLLGPEVAGLINPASLGRGLETVIGLAVAVVLFEGGLTLDITGYRRAPRVIQRMLTLGVLVTWFGTAFTVWLVFGWSPSVSLLAGSLVIVTGPTVISPLLRRMHLRERLHHILYWEGVLIDAIGVFVAVFCFEYLSGKGGEVVEPVMAFVVRILVAVGLGTASGAVIGVALRRHWVEDEHANIFALGVVLVTYGIANAAMDESGVLAVVATGLVVGWMRPRQLTRMKAFKLELTELAIGLLFVLLSAKLELASFAELGVDLVIVIAVLLVVLRPLNIAVSTIGEKLDWRERLFLSWLAPRGIVAASMASLFSLRLAALGYPEAIHLETLTYAVIATTVALQGLSAPLVARLLRVDDPPRRTWLLLGEPALAGGIGRALQRAGVRAHTFVGPADTDPVQEVLDGGDEDALVDPRLGDVDSVLVAYNDGRQRQLAARTWAAQVGRAHCLVWAPPGQSETEHDDPPGIAAFSTLRGPAEVAAALSDGSLAVQLCHTSPGVAEPGRFGPHFAPLFWIQGDEAIPQLDPLSDAVPLGEHAVVLKRRVRGFEGLIADVDVLDDEGMMMRGVLLRLLQVVAVDEPQLPLESLLEGLLAREATMSSSVGGGIAIPHAYFPGLERPRCYLALIPGGLEDEGSDEAPIRLVCLVLSPPDRARDHLQALAALAIVLGDEAFRALLLRQETPDQARRLLDERG